jgi:Zn ribbon nucleic-acid-binding protein
MTFTYTVPTLLLHPTTACPRCDGRRILALATNTENRFAWHECHECGYLWAVPHGWMTDADARPPHSAKRGIA